MFWEIHPTPADKSFKQISRYNAGPYSAYGVLDHDCTDSAVLLCVELQVVVSQILNSLGHVVGVGEHHGHGVSHNAPHAGREELAVEEVVVLNLAVAVFHSL